MAHGLAHELCAKSSDNIGKHLKCDSSYDGFFFDVKDRINGSCVHCEEQQKYN